MQVILMSIIALMRLPTALGKRMTMPMPRMFSNLQSKTKLLISHSKGICTEITTSWWSYYASNDTTKYTAESEYSAASDISCG